MNKQAENNACACVNWITNINLINSAFVISHFHGLGGYSGKFFVYCPWCGEKLKAVSNAKTKK